MPVAGCSPSSLPSVNNSIPLAQTYYLLHNQKKLFKANYVPTADDDLVHNRPIPPDHSKLEVSALVDCHLKN